VGQTLDVGVQVASALAAAHQAGIIHRDIKPENIMVRTDGNVKVLDFGLAKLTDPKTIETAAPTLVETAPGVVMGTFSYMSPEQARGLAVDTRTDIWSLGVMIYEMAAGRQPFEGETASDVMSLILQKEPPPLAYSWPEVPTELERIVRKALRKDKEERYQTIKDLLIDLRNLRKELELSAEMERSAPPTGRAMSSGQSAAATAHSASSAEYIVTEIKQHKRGLAVALAAMILLSVAGIAYYFGRGGKTAIDSIAVLPLVNTGGDPNTEYLSDGISEALINSLTELQQLKVIARTTAFRYKGKEIDPQAVGRELNVRAVLTGRVRQTGEMLDIQVDLVDATTGAELWGREYERKVSDVLSVKQAIAREITEKLRLKLSGEEQKRLTGRDTTNADAYQFYLRGRYFWNKRTADGLKKAIEQFQQATDLDPNYALGYVGLADCYAALEQYAGTPASEALPKAKAYAQRALQLDDSLAEAHASLGINNDQLWQFGEAEQEYKRAISLNPNYPTGHQWYSVHLRTLGRLDEAMAEIKHARELDPLSPIISENVTASYLQKGDLDAAIEQARKIIELDPNYPGGHQKLGVVYLRQQRYPEAIVEFQKAVDMSGRASNQLSSLGYGYAVAGKRAEALAIEKELEEKYAKREASAFNVASVYASLGDKDQAFAWLEKAFQIRSSLLRWITVDPFFDSLRSDSRYADLLRRVGLQP